MLIRKLQAKHIPDVSFLMTLVLMGRAQLAANDYDTVMIWELEKVMPHIPRKVLLAKARQLEKRKLLDGCWCGCRGDFRVTDEGLRWLGIVSVEALGR